LGPARGTYLEGYGAVFTFELNLVLSSPLAISPFNPNYFQTRRSPPLHDRKIKKAEALKESMRGPDGGRK